MGLSTQIRNVTRTPNVNLTCSENVRAAAGILCDDDDPNVQRCISQASRMIERHCSRIFRRERIVERMPGTGTAEMVLSRRPGIIIHDCRYDQDLRMLEDLDFIRINDDAGIVWRDIMWAQIPVVKRTLTDNILPFGSKYIWSFEYTAGYSCFGDSLESYTELCDGGSDSLRLMCPCEEMENDQAAVTEIIDTITGDTVDPTTYTQNPVNELAYDVLLNAGGNWPGTAELYPNQLGDRRYQVTYYGAPNVPDDLERVAIDLAATLFDSGGDNQRIKSQGEGGSTQTFRGIDEFLKERLSAWVSPV